jgi:dTDP-4-amino-4,6-dideoxygalactose transaminase
MDGSLAIERMRTSSISALVITHLYGLLVDYSKVLNAARDLGVVVIEDCAQAHGAVLDGKVAGSFGDMSTFSFYPTKNLGALGDGGGIYTENEQYVSKIKALRQYGWESEKYNCTVKGGWNSRLDEMQAAILRVLLPYLPGWNVKRRNVAKKYRALIKNPKVSFFNHDLSSNYVAHLMIIKSDQRDNLMSHLKKNGVSCDIHFPIVDYKQGGSVKNSICPKAENLVNQVLTLPLAPELTDNEIQRVVEVINVW